MKDRKKGFILPMAKAPHGGGQAKGHANVDFYRFLGRTAELGEGSPEDSLHVQMKMAVVKPGGGVREHYHQHNAGSSVVDHLYYVISGRIRATVGDIEETVGPDTLIYCTSNVRHSITNVGKDNAKVISIDGAGRERKGVE